MGPRPFLHLPGACTCCCLCSAASCFLILHGPPFSPPLPHLPYLCLSSLITPPAPPSLQTSPPLLLLPPHRPPHTPPPPPSAKTPPSPLLLAQLLSAAAAASSPHLPPHTHTSCRSRVCLVLAWWTCIKTSRPHSRSCRCVGWVQGGKLSWVQGG